MREGGASIVGTYSEMINAEDSLVACVQFLWGTECQKIEKIIEVCNICYYYAEGFDPA